MKKKLNRKDAECIMSMVGLLTAIELADMDDFFEVMVSIETYTIDLPNNHVDYLVYYVQALHDD